MSVAALSCDQLSLRGDQCLLKGRAGLISACFLVAAHPASAEVSRSLSPPAATAPRGVFSSVRYIEEAGDLLGYELRFFQRDGRSMSEMVACEGWCTSSRIVPVVRRGNAFELSYAEAADSSANHLLRTRLQFRWVGRRLALAAWYDDRPRTCSGRIASLLRAHAPMGWGWRIVSRAQNTIAPREWRSRNDHAGVAGACRNE